MFKGQGFTGNRSASPEIKQKKINPINPTFPLLFQIKLPAMSQLPHIITFQIEQQIFMVRQLHVMIDHDLAQLYEVHVKRLNEQVKRNISRFPEQFRFQLTTDEKTELVANCDRFHHLKYSSSNPYAFTEQGVAMLSAVLRSATAINVSIEIMNVFVALRKTQFNQQGIFQRVEHIEQKQRINDQKFEQLFSAMENKQLPAQGLFLDGKVFDAYELTSRIIRSAKQHIVLIDNYIDEQTFTQLAKKQPDVRVYILTKTSIAGENNASKQLALDLKKANQQYNNFELIPFSKSHDRFLIIDKTHVYHLGASLKDLGKKWFAFTQLHADSVRGLLREVEANISN